MYGKFSLEAHFLHAHATLWALVCWVPSRLRQIVFVLGIGTPRYRHKNEGDFVPTETSRHERFLCRLLQVLLPGTHFRRGKCVPIT